MLRSTSSRKARFACPPFPLWNLPSFTVKSTFSASRNRFDPLLSRQGAALTHLDSLLPHDLVIQTDDSLPFSLEKTALVSWPTTFFLALRSLSPFWQAQYAQVFPLKPAPFCKLFAGLGRTNKYATSLLSSSSFLTLVLSLRPCLLLRISFCLNLSRRNSLLFSSVLSDW